MYRLLKCKTVPAVAIKASLPLLIALTIVSCQSKTPLSATLAPATSQPTATEITVAASTTASTKVSATAAPTTAPTEVSASGDVPDNAVFVRYASQDGGYSMEYVEGWTVEPQAQGGVTISDKDSSEVVKLVPMPTGDINTYITAVDEAQLKQTAQGYKRVDLGTVKVKGQTIPVLSYSWTSAPNPVTDKSLPVTSLRYYLPGKNGQLAMLTLTTPDGVDNVDAFNQMLGSFTWSP